MSKTSLAKKLRIQPGQRLLILNPPSGYLDELDLPVVPLDSLVNSRLSKRLPQLVVKVKACARYGVLSTCKALTQRLRVTRDLPEGVELAEEPGGTFDFVHLFVKNTAELENLGPTAIKAVKYDGLLWMSYPKRSSKVETDLTRDVGWEMMAEAGLRPVTQVSVNDIWSALRFRPIDQVGR